jgi:hypothetical protein
MSTETIFRTLVRPQALAHGLGAASVVTGEGQHSFALQFQDLRGSQSRAIPREVASEHAGYIEQ